MTIPLILAYDRFEGQADPLTDIIQCLWNNDIGSIHRFADSTLEFNLSTNDEDDTKAKITKLHEELSKIAHIRLSSPSFILGEGNEKLDKNLQIFIREKVIMGILKRPKGWNG